MQLLEKKETDICVLIWKINLPILKYEILKICIVFFLINLREVKVLLNFSPLLAWNYAYSLRDTKECEIVSVPSKNE